jgi:hypothetical protein
MAKEGNKSGDCLGQFANDLVEYLERAYCSKPGDKLATAVGYWVDRLRAGRADFGHVRARLVSSVPGRHLKVCLFKR